MNRPHFRLATPKGIFANFFVLAVFLLISIQVSNAAVPETINYQGFLADDSGVPIDATHDITFRIYNASSGGSALYTSTQTIPISDGRFNTELGGSPSFPANLFDGTPLFLSLEIDSDGEMSPRQPLSSTPFAHKAEDADTVGGLSAASLDQSAHVGNVDNPHNVTPFQIGAASQNDLSDHAISESVHHFRYTDVDAVAAMGVKGNANPLNHNRYTNSDAVNAMGSNSDSNSLNHDRYTDDSAVRAILASDGPSSELDADLLDGMQASQIIDAANVEVRTPIFDSDLPLVISAPGSYYFAENLFYESTDNNAITLDPSAERVTIDMMGFTLTGPGKTSSPQRSGIYVDAPTGASIKNGTIEKFGGTGIFGSIGAPNTVPMPKSIENVHVINNGQSGISLSGSQSRVIRSVARLNGEDGILTGGESLLVDNASVANGAQGLRVGSNSYLAGNVVHSSSSFGIVVGGGSTIINNTSSSNQGWGITTSDYSLVESNTVMSNNQSDSSSRSGIQVGDNNRVVGNKVGNNKQFGVIVNGSGNIIESNHITDSPVALKFNFSGSARRNNTFSGNTVVTSGTHVDGGGGLIF